MAVEIQGVDIIVRVREAGETDWLELVCEIDNTVDHSNDTTETKTKCGKFVGIDEMSGNYSGNAVSNAVPGAGEASYEQILTWQKARTPLEILIENEAFTSSSGSPIAEGSAVHVFAEGKFTQTVLTSPTGEVVKFSWTFKPTGNINISGTST